jgi:uncharacterized membrane protein
MLLGLDNLDPIGALHTVFGFAALALGLSVILLEKGTPLHRRVGLVYLLAMVLLNGSAFLIYDLFGRWGPFHTLAVVSLVTITAGVLHVWLRWPAYWENFHARAMAWSYAGVVAAFASEIGARIPGVGLVRGVLIPSGIVLIVSAFLIHTQVRRVLAGRPAPGRDGPAGVAR